VSETKFTKGPWGIEYDGHEANIIGPVPYTSDQRDIAYVNSEVGDIDGFACGVTAQANAHLIAAAPELYEALEDVAKVIACGNLASVGAQDLALFKAQAAQAKARGEG